MTLSQQHLQVTLYINTKTIPQGLVLLLLSIASVCYADKNLPIVVEKNGTATSHHSPVTAKAVTTMHHPVHQLKQNEQRIISPIFFGACICTHCEMVQSSPTFHLFTKHHTQLVKHPVSMEAQSI